VIRVYEVVMEGTPEAWNAWDAGPNAIISEWLEYELQRKALLHQATLPGKNPRPPDIRVTARYLTTGG
jgi:hypothetical protein